jgi:hypothetical protein
LWEVLVNDPTWALYGEVVQKALARNQMTDPGDALCALLWLLRDRHRAAVSAFASRGYREGFELPDPGASTVAERIKDLAARAADRHRRDGGDERSGRAVVCGTEALASPMQVVADVLGELIPLWDFEVAEDAARPGRWVPPSGARPEDDDS